MNERIRAALDRARERQKEKAPAKEASAGEVGEAMRRKLEDVIVPHFRMACLELEGVSGASYGFHGFEVFHPDIWEARLTFSDATRDGALGILTIQARGHEWRVTIRSADPEGDHPDEEFETDDRDMDANQVVSLIERTIGAIYGT